MHATYNGSISGGAEKKTTKKKNKFNNIFGQSW